MRTRTFVVIAFAIVFGIGTYLFFTSQPVDFQAYIPNAGDGTITVIDAQTQEILHTLKVGESTSHGIAVTPDNRFFYTGNLDDGQVFVYSTLTRELVTSIEVGERVHGIDMSPDGKYVLVSAGRSGGPYLAVIDTNSNSVIAEVTDQLAIPTHIDFSPDGKRAYVADPGADGVVVVNVGDWTVETVVATGEGAQETELSPDGDVLYVANYAAQTMSVVDTSTLEVVQQVEAGDKPHAIAVSPDGKQVWLANHGSSEVLVYDAEADYKLVKRLALSPKPNHVTFHPSGDRVYITDLTDSKLRIVDATTFETTKTMALGASPHEIDFVALRK